MGGGSTFRLGFETGSDTGPPSVLAGTLRLACPLEDKPRNTATADTLIDIFQRTQAEWHKFTYNVATFDTLNCVPG